MAFALRRVAAAGDDAAIAWIARGMHATLVEVEGEAVGGALYTPEWLLARVRWHLDPSCSTAAVWVAERAPGEIAGHTIVRVERREDGTRFGLVSTTYVDPAWRREGLASRLLAQGEAWFVSQALDESSTWTSATNAKLIALYGRAGYREVERGPNEQTGTVMVRLARRLAPAG
jgi:GNAT superfamily N-acetyltransferase